MTYTAEQEEQSWYDVLYWVRPCAKGPGNECIHTHELAMPQTDEAAREKYQEYLSNGWTPVDIRDIASIARDQNEAAQNKRDLDKAEKRAHVHWATYEGMTKACSGYNVFIPFAEVIGQPGDAVPTFREALAALATQPDGVDIPAT